MPFRLLLASAISLCSSVALTADSAPANQAKYVGSEACAGCHKDITQSYRQTGMGRSMAPAVNLHLPDSGKITNGPQKRVFESYSKDGFLFQTESGEQDGKVAFRSTYHMDWAIGSGDHGLSFLSRRGQHIFQAPLSWYSSTNAWDLSPGYDRVDFGLSRPIATGCIACHSARPQPIADRGGMFGDPPFLELPIGCENCHGPGEAHAKNPTRQTIVNPARLTARLADNVCMYCHENGDSRILLPGKAYSDFRPGTWLGDTVAIFKIRVTGGDTDVLEHNDAMSQSRCFTASQGKLSCITCHDPHQRIDAPKSVAFYREKCFSCHTDKSCTLPLVRRQANDDCAGCHMPKRPIGQIAHTALTNHRIPKVPAAQPPPIVFGNELDWINPPPGQRLPNQIALLRAYAEVTGAQPAFREKYITLLAQLGQNMPNDPLVQSSLGQKLLVESRTDASADEALAHYKRALELGSQTAEVHIEMADAFSRLNRFDESVAQLKIALDMKPYDRSIRRGLAVRLLAMGKNAEALEVIRQQLELFPEDDMMRDLLSKNDEGR
jgi:hypothetical protein